MALVLASTLSIAPPVIPGISRLQMTLVPFSSYVNPADERDVHRLPLGGSPRHVLARRDEPVEPAEMV